MKQVSAAVVWMLIPAVGVSCSRRLEPRNPDEIKSAKTTEVVAALDAPVPPGKNVVWCASFLAAWKTLAAQVAQEPISLEAGNALVASLNRAPGPRPVIPPAALYAMAGWKPKGVVEQIHRELAQKFPSKPAPTFPGAAADAFIAYAYVEAGVKFTLPYFQSRQPLEFTEAQGRKTPVMAFGIRPEDDYAYYKLRGQPRILFRKGEGHEGNLEFAMDLCADSQPSQIVVARINREPSLAAAIARVERECRELDQFARTNPGLAKYLRTFGPNDVLLVPDMFWQVSHRFTELEGKSFANARLRGQRLDVAQQDILFRLDRSGAELKSESKVYYAPVPTYFVLDRPFLIYLCQRGAKTPYLALWIDNAELLRKWSK